MPKIAYINKKFYSSSLWIIQQANGIRIRRIALNFNQIEQYSPPPNPAKLSDTRASKYISKFGYESWELDALEPRILRQLIEENILIYRNEETYQKVLEQEKEYLDILKRVEENWQTL